MKGAG